MFLSDLSIRRPVLATVFSMLLVVFGIISFERLPVREYPDIDPPVVTVETTYPGASANVVETRITELIEDRLSGLEGIKTIYRGTLRNMGWCDTMYNFRKIGLLDLEEVDVRDKTYAGFVRDLVKAAEGQETRGGLPRRMGVPPHAVPPWNLDLLGMYEDR